MDETQNRRPEGEEGAGAHQEGRHSVQAGQTQRREQSPPEKSRPESAEDNKHAYRKSQEDPNQPE
jgi:hypothetical protein